MLHFIMIRFFYAFCILFFLNCCEKPHYSCPMLGVCEFVQDSHKIQQGKSAILEVQGIDHGCLPPCYLQEYKDTVDEDDILKITIYHPARKDICEVVNEIGNQVGYRVINGFCILPELPPVKVKGLTLSEARELIESYYRTQIADVEVFIDYKERLSRVVELTGRIEVPIIPVDGRIRLYDVLAKARMTPDANLFKSYVVRDCKTLPVDLHKLIKEGDMCQNIVMRPRDKIFIADPSESTVMVMGEVGAPRVIQLHRGSISLREAIVNAGGILFTGDKRCIQVIRGDVLCPRVYILDWNRIACCPNKDLLLIPGDTVYISEKPITQWNRFLEQLLPSCIGIQQAQTTCSTVVGP